MSNKRYIRSFFILMIISLFVSCRINSNSSLIEYFTYEIDKYGDNYQKIIYTLDTIKTQNIQFKVHNWPKFQKHLRVEEYHVQDSTFIDDFVFPESFYYFFSKRKITDVDVKVNSEVKFSYLHKRNYNFNQVFFIFFYNGFDEGKKEYKENGFDVYSGSEIPENYSNWLYKINDNWAILSPKKEN